MMNGEERYHHRSEEFIFYLVFFAVFDEAEMRKIRLDTVKKLSYQALSVQITEIFKKLILNSINF